MSCPLQTAYSTTFTAWVRERLYFGAHICMFFGLFCPAHAQAPRLMEDARAVMRNAPPPPNDLWTVECITSGLHLSVFELGHTPPTICVMCRRYGSH
jgi:hypothetical protein